ncbi:hypothetical protein [Tellurirhabdus rosea]|uniref:hypothetical protein n=1 Tax=Tellurirhabdus rosea TaxID=2674997 RepID=UPI00224E2009|nr:hypothetical protein [Tellurirhabdus rosea]
MKTQVCLLLVALSAWLTPTGEAREVTESSPTTVLLDGRPLNDASFSIRSRGRLSIISGSSGSSEISRIPFRIYLQRQGSVIASGASNPTQPVTDVEVSTVLQLAVPGDQLTIEPVGQNHLRAKRVLNVIYYYDWLSLPFKKRSQTFRNNDGC